MNIMNTGDKAMLSPANLAYLELVCSSQSSPPSFLVLSVDQDFLNGAASGLLRIATMNTIDVHG